MKTSEIGLKKIAVREGTVLHSYKDSKGLLTAGVGHLLDAEERKQYPLNTKITQAQCDKWLAEDAKECEDAVNSLGVSLKQNEFDALVSLAFNIGVGGFKKSTVARRLKAGDKPAAAEAILLWNKPPEIQGRRRTEYNQFLTPYKQVPGRVPQDSAITSASTATGGNPSDTLAPDNSSITETKATEITQQAGTTLATEVKTPAGDPPEAAPVQVSKNGPLARWIAGGGGLGALGTFIWGYVTSNPSAVGIGIICVTLLIVVIIFRGTITDAVRMQIHADPDKKNVS